MTPNELLVRSQKLTLPGGALTNFLNPYLKILELASLQKGEKNNSDFLLQASACVFAGDHKTAHNHEVSAFPSVVTGQMVLNFIAVGAAMSVLCKEQNIPLSICTVGVAKATSQHLKLNKIENEAFQFNEYAAEGNTFDFGALDITTHNALSHNAFQYAWKIGAEKAQHMIDKDGANVLIFGEMGIGNTTNSAALAMSLLDLSQLDCVGIGTGIDSKKHAIKQRVVSQALSRIPRQSAPMFLLEALGGFEIVALAGAMQAAIDLGKVVLLDGLISTAAAFALFKENPSSSKHFIASHEGAEPLHKHLLKAMHLQPLLSLEMRLGEGSGSAMAWALLRQAESLVRKMATFESASVSEEK